MPVLPNSPLTCLAGVGPERAKKLAKLGLEQVVQLLRHYPRDYEDRRTVYSIAQAPLEGRVCVSAMAAQRPRLSRVRRGLELVQVQVVDNTGTLYLTFFNQGYVQQAIQPGQDYIFYGSVELQGRRRTMVNPIFERLGQGEVTGRIVPVYPLTAGISNHLMASLVRQALPCAQDLEDTLPQQIRQQYALCAVDYAVQNIHFPAHQQALELARRRLTFEELFYLSVGLSFLKKRRELEQDALPIPAAPWQDFAALLPFAPTAAQRRVMDQLAADMASGRPMNRLVQGDVGSGKTVVAAYGGWLCAKTGAQTALMAPTEVLAQQHYRSLSTLLAPDGVRVGLLTGSMPAGEKKRVRSALQRGQIDFVVGTHALLSDTVAFHRLALIVADEQHRFGVAQRAALAAKSGRGLAPHVLVMSATPIPRTLALIIYGDLDLSVIDQLPPGRTPVETYVVREDKRQRMYEFIRRQAAQGRQAYIICPAVEEGGDASLSPAAQLKAVTSYAHQLQHQVFPQLRLGVLHGRMKPREKEAVMSAFVSGQIQVLVATTVVEVGVDVPNASLIVIENAERFGLSQLHQLRGRVGRGGHQSYCVMITATRSPDSMQRLRTLASTTDGFKISEEDLKARGPGDFFGDRQHGLPQMKLADLAGDMRLLDQAQQAAQQLLSRDPQLSLPENGPVLRQVCRMFADTPDIFN